MRRRTIVAVTTVLWGITAVLAVGATTQAAGAAPAAPGADCKNGPNGQTCDAGAGQPGTKLHEDISGIAKSGAKSGPLMCPWPPREDQPATWIDLGPDETGHFKSESAGPPDGPWIPQGGKPGEHYWLAYCAYHINSWWNGANLVGGGWSNTGQPPPQPPNAPQVRDAMWAHIQGTLKDPQLTLAPDQGTHSVLNVPTFVAINNPQPSKLWTATVGNVNVWIAVVPANTLHPGEPGAPAVPCDDDGTAYDPTGAPPKAQASAADGCVYTYTKRSRGWNGDVTITWNVTWGSNQNGQGGTLNAAPQAGGFVRIVDEVQGIVTGAGK